MTHVQQLVTSQKDVLLGMPSRGNWFSSLDLNVFIRAGGR